MDQSQNNLERIRALDAEEGEWRTINGAHVLIKNGRIAAGAGGALNGQRFQGHSIRASADISTHPAHAAGYKEGLAHVASFRGKPNAEMCAAAQSDAAAKLKKWKGIAARNPDDDEAKKQVGFYTGAHKAWGDRLKAHHENSDLVATPSTTRASGPSQPPASSTPSTPDLSARPGHAIGYQDGMRFAAKTYKNLSDNELKSKLQEAKSGVERWSKLAVSYPDDYDMVKQVGFYTGLQKALQKQLDPSSTTPGRSSKIKPLPFNFRGKNYNKEAKRIAHNARVYHRTARRAYEKAEREARPLGEAARIPQSQLPEYKRMLSEKMDKRDNDAIAARQKLIGMQERTRMMKRRWPNLFARHTSQPAPAPTTSQSPASSPAPSPTAASRRPTLGRMKPGMKGRGTASELAKTRKAGKAEVDQYNQKGAETEKKYNGIHNRINEEMNALPRTAPDFARRMAQLEKASAKNNRANEQSRKLSSNIHLSRMDQIGAREEKLQNASKRASEHLAAHPELKRGGRRVPATSSPSATGRRLGRVPAGYTGKNYDKETKRLTHNAQVYHRTARRAMEKKAANSTPSEYKDYERRMNENMKRRDSDAASAKNRLASMRKMAKALKQSHPEVFAKIHALKAKMSGQ
jgi:hypothetical protein